MTTASIATSLVACFIQLICLMSRPLRTMLRVTKHFKKKCVLLFGMNRLKHRKENNKCENFLLVWEFCGEPGEVWEFKKMFAFQNGVEIPTPRASLVHDGGLITWMIPCIFLFVILNMVISVGSIFWNGNTRMKFLEGYLRLAMTWRYHWGIYVYINIIIYIYYIYIYMYVLHIRKITPSCHGISKFWWSPG